MICPNCQHQNDGGNFCEKCGTKLTGNVNPEVAASSETSNRSFVSQTPTVNNVPNSNAIPNQYLEKTKNVSKLYFSYFMHVLKKPYANSQSVGGEHFLNAIITMILYSLIIPLIFYFGLKGLLSNINDFGSALFGEEVAVNPPFFDVVIKPTFAFVIFILLVAIITFAAVKLGRINASFKEVISRFGSFLIPIVIILAVALIFSILKIEFFLVVLLLGFIGSIFLVPPLVIASFKKDTQVGMDVIYGSLVTYVFTFIVIRVMGDILFESLKNAFGDLFGILGGI